MTTVPKLDPQAQNLLAQMPVRRPRREGSIEEARAGLVAAAAAAFGPVEPVARVVDLAVRGHVTIPVRLYHPDPKSVLPAVVYAHGGGWVLGDLETHDRLCRALAGASGCAVIAIDYRRAPEHPFPAAWLDVQAVLREVAANPVIFGIDPACIALAGDSAGGQLMAATALWARDAGIAIRHVVLLLPDVDNHPERWPSHREFDERYGLYPDDQVWYYEQYFGRDWRSLEGAGVSPLHADLSGVASMTIVLAECDPVHDEGAAFARRLDEAAVPVEVLDYAGMFHPFILFRGLDATRRAERDVAATLRRHLLD